VASADDIRSLLRGLKEHEVAVSGAINVPTGLEDVFRGLGIPVLILPKGPIVSSSSHTSTAVMPASNRHVDQEPASLKPALMHYGTVSQTHAIPP
jgi:hypothetical protein